MQPYWFPYIGYFQLIAHSDVFVIRDEVQYTKEGWINRNRFLVAGEPRWITLPVKRAPHRSRISEREYLLEQPEVDRVARRLEEAYRSAPQFEAVRRLVTETMSYDTATVSAFNTNAIEAVLEFIGVDVEVLAASSLQLADGVGGEDRVIEICRRVNATRYLNPIGGRTLYSAERFADGGLELAYLTPGLTPYEQFGGPFVESLSIIDVLMFNDRRAVRAMVTEGGSVECDE